MNLLDQRIRTFASQGLSPYEIEERLGMEHYTIHIKYHQALMALKLEGIINQELIGDSRHNGYAYVLNFKRLKELGAPHVDSFFKGYVNER